MDIERVKLTLDKLNEFGNTEAGITRLAYSEEDKKCCDLFLQMCRQEKLQARIDQCGNIIARRLGVDHNASVVAMGSHLDTVIQGGRFDGTLGVVAALEVIRSLNEKGINTLHPIELIVFACEESSRFGYSTLGSKAMAGVLDMGSVHKLKDKNNITIQDAFKASNLDFTNIEKAYRKDDFIKAFLELHVEQGPILEKKGREIGIVTGIAAPTRVKVEVEGTAAHSGSTAMGYRRDALMGAAEIALALEQAAIEESYMGTVGTVGVLEVKPGAMNVIPGKVEMQIDIRGIDRNSKDKVLHRLYQAIDKVKVNRKLDVTREIISDENPILLGLDIINELESICIDESITYEKMPSGAGHDAMNMAKICPTGLIFVPSKDGLSHNPNEHTAWEEIARGVELLEKAVRRMAIEL